MAKKKEKTAAQIKAEERQAAAFKALAAFTHKTAKELDVSTSMADLTSGRQGRNGAIPTASLCADLIMGGGIPKHRLTIFSGWEGTGKTTLMQSSLTNQLTRGGIAHYGDFEGAADGGWIKNGTGVDLTAYEGLKKDSVQTFYPLFDFQSGDDYFRYINRLLEETVKLGLEDLPGLTHLFALDSIPMLPSEGQIEDDDTGDKPWVAILMSRYLRLIRSRFKRANSSMVAINQLRLKIRLKYPNENPEYEPGGNIPRFAADVRLRFDPFKPTKVDGGDHPLLTEKISKPKQGGVSEETNPDGSIDRYVYRKLHTVKNRVFPPFLSTYMRICISKNGGEGTGIDKVFDTLRFYEEIGRLKWENRSGQNGGIFVNLDGKEFSYFDLKKEIETNSDLREEAMDLMECGKAFEGYFARKGADIGKPDPEETEEEAKQLEKAEAEAVNAEE